MPEPRVLSVVWNLIRGGTEGQCARVAMALAQRGHTHRVAVFRREGLLLEPVESVCGPVYHFGIQRLAEWRTAEAVLRLRRHLRDERIDVLHTWDADAAVFGSWAARLAGIPWITSRRDLGEIYPGWKLRLMRGADRGARAVVANADAIARMAARHVEPAKLRVIPNILDASEFDARLRTGWTGARLPPGPRVVHVARLDPEKDLPTFLRAARIVRQARPDAVFVVAGDGRERAALEKMAGESGMSEGVVFLGDVQDVPALLGECAIGALLPNRNEGLSNTILEYMAASLPVVATDCGGNSELVEDGVTGHLVPVGDAQSAASRMLDLLHDAARGQAFGKAGRQLVLARHGVERVADSFAELYREVAGAA